MWELEIVIIKFTAVADFKYGEITEKIIGAAFRVHNTLGCGFQKVIYQRALEMEFRLIPLAYII